MYYYTLVVLAYATFLLDNFNVRNKEKYSCLFAYVFFSVIFFISSFRYEVGSDYPGYKEIFEYDDPIEPLFALLIKAVKYIGGNYEVFVAIIFILSFGLKLFVFRKLAFRKGFYLSMMLFCSFYYIAYEMNAIRQGLAMSLTLLAVYYAYMRKKIKYITVCLLASFIHYTAFCFIPFYLLLNIKLKKIHIVGICLLCVLLSMNQIFNIFMDMASMYLGDSAMGDRILAYGENGDASSNVLFSSGTLRRLFFFGLIIYSIDKIEATERLKQIILWGAFLSIVTYLLFSQIGYFSIRLSAYYRIIECIWLSYFPLFGIIDLAGLPKDRYYLYRSHWNKDEETLHILPHWTWPGREGEVTPIFVYTNYPAAEVFINGKSQGKRTKDLSVTPENSADSASTADFKRQQRYRLMWMDTKYEPGTVKVVAYNDKGEAVAEKEIHTAGKPDHIELVADRNEIKADGKDLSFVTVRVVDKDGNLCPDAQHLIKYSVKGAGTYRAGANGNPASLELFHLPQMKVFNGMMTAIVQSTDKPGEITLTATGKGLKSGRLVLMSK